MMLSAANREFFAAVATAAAALTGLLFVAISVAPQRSPATGPAVIQQVRAAAALVAFFNALAVPLFGLVPGISVRYPAVVLGVGGILFTAAGTRSIWSSPATTRERVRQLGLVVALLLIFGTQLTAGVILLVQSRRSTPLDLIGAALVASLLVGVARAWELVGARDTGIIASLAVLSRHAPAPARAAGPGGAGAAGPTAGGGQAGPPPGDHSGDDNAALRLYQGLLPDQERILGAQDPATLTTRANIAGWTGQSGDPATALRLYQELLPDRERVLGAGHPDTLTTHAEIARWGQLAAQP